MANEKEIKEINRHIRDGINQWADVMLTADADEWAYRLDYYPRDLMNATLIFQHVASNIGIKAGRIDSGQRATEYGERLRQLVIDMTGYDPHTFWSDPHADGPDKPEPQDIEPYNDF